MRILLGVSGGIAAYKVAIVLRQLRERGHHVRVIPTESALEFVGRATWEALSGEPVTTSVFEGTESVDHVRLGRERSEERRVGKEGRARRGAGDTRNRTRA